MLEQKPKPSPVMEAYHVAIYSPKNKSDSTPTLWVYAKDQHGRKWCGVLPLEELHMLAGERVFEEELLEEQG